MHLDHDANQTYPFESDLYHFSTTPVADFDEAVLACKDYIDTEGNSGYKLVESNQDSVWRLLTDVARALVHFGERDREMGYYVGKR